jgi:hypothetical protein
MGLIARTPICGDCMASFGRDREGPCEAPGCSGHVSWEAAFDALATTHRGAVGRIAALERELGCAIDALEGKPWTGWSTDTARDTLQGRAVGRER